MHRILMVYALGLLNFILIFYVPSLDVFIIGIAAGSFCFGIATSLLIDFFVRKNYE